MKPFVYYLQAGNVSNEIAELLGTISQQRGYVLVRDPALLGTTSDANHVARVTLIEAEDDGSQVDFSEGHGESGSFLPSGTVPTILIVRAPRLEAVVEAMQRGAFSVLRYPIDHLKLDEEIQQAMNLSKCVVDHRIRWETMDKQLQGLTEGEFQVLRFVMEGSLNKRIAGRLGISERTVEARRKRIFEKTKTHSVAQLVREIVETVGADSVFYRGDDAQTNHSGHHWNRSGVSISGPIVGNFPTLPVDRSASSEELDDRRPR